MFNFLVEMPEFLNGFLESAILQGISNFIDNYVNQGIAFIQSLDPITKAGIAVGGAILLVLGAIDLIKRMTKLLVVAVIVFGLWFVYTTYVVA